MLNAIILHGTGTRCDEFWFPWLKAQLEARGYDVWLPQLPHDERPNLREWLPFVMTGGRFTDETILIGHSAGAQLILSVLEALDVTIRQAVLVSGYARALRPTPDTDEPGPLDWAKARGKARQLTFINSDNDPWGCDDHQGRLMLDQLGGVLVVPKGEGHMGSGTYGQPYREHPLAMRMLDI